MFWVVVGPAIVVVATVVDVLGLVVLDVVTCVVFDVEDVKLLILGAVGGSEVDLVEVDSVTTENVVKVVTTVDGL